MRKLLIVSDSGQLHTGQARVVRELAQRFLTYGVDVVVAGWWHQLANQILICPILLSQSAKSSRMRCCLFFVVNIPIPSWLLAIHGIFNGSPGCGPAPMSFGSMAISVSSSAVPSKMEQVIDGFDVLATTSEYSAKQIDRHYVPAIHSGVDMAVFQPTHPQISSWAANPRISSCYW